METYINMKNCYDYSKLKTAANIIKNGGIVIVPTETVYGLATNAFNEASVKKIFDIKKRPLKNPINLLVDSIEMINSIAQDITPLEYKLIKKFTPGPFTIILHKRKIIPNIITSGLDTVGIRIPNEEITKKLIEYAGVPIAAPSANLSGKTSSTMFDDVYRDFNGKVDYMIDNGNSSIGIESTIVQVIAGIPHILRPGSISYDDILSVSKVNVIKDYENDSTSHLPSKNLNHYNMNNEAVLIYSDNTDVLVDNVIHIAKKYSKPIILSSNNNIKQYTKYTVINLGNNLDEIAKNLFTNLKKADSLNPDIIIIEGIPSIGIGEAIMNRLKKLCNNNFFLY